VDATVALSVGLTLGVLAAALALGITVARLRAAAAQPPPTHRAAAAAAELVAASIAKLGHAEATSEADDAGVASPRAPEPHNASQRALAEPQALEMSRRVI
jgi:hypothetical protein